MSSYFTPASAKLIAAESGIEAADPAGHALTAGGEWQFTLSTTEPLVGIYRVNVLDGDGVQVGVFWVWIEADDTRTYIADTQFGLAALRKSIITEVKLSERIGSLGEDMQSLSEQIALLGLLVTSDAIKAATRRALNGLWRDEFGEGFTCEVTDP